MGDDMLRPAPVLSQQSGDDGAIALLEKATILAPQPILIRFNHALAL
jgi:hypothetical protein